MKLLGFMKDFKQTDISQETLVSKLKKEFVVLFLCFTLKTKNLNRNNKKIQMFANISFQLRPYSESLPSKQLLNEIIKNLRK